MENLWKTYGKPMGNLWKSYGKPMKTTASNSPQMHSTPIYLKSNSNQIGTSKSLPQIKSTSNGACKYYFLLHLKRKSLPSEETLPFCTFMIRDPLKSGHRGSGT